MPWWTWDYLLPLCVLWNSIFYLVLNSFEIVTHMAAGIENEFFSFHNWRKRSWPRKSAWEWSQVFASLMFQMLWTFYQCSYHSDHHKGMKCYSGNAVRIMAFCTSELQNTGHRKILTPLPFRGSISVNDQAPISSEFFKPFRGQLCPHLNSPMRPLHPAIVTDSQDQVTKGTITTQWRTASEAQHHWLHALLG